jgi:hypothetical protein
MNVLKYQERPEMLTEEYGEWCWLYPIRNACGWYAGYTESGRLVVIRW